MDPPAAQFPMLLWPQFTAVLTTPFTVAANCCVLGVAPTVTGI
jgi:hypothetical protein